MYSCASCNASFTDGTQCCVCKRYLDFPCSGITEAGYRRLGERKNNWRCPQCKSSPAPSPSPLATFPVPNIQFDSVQSQLSIITQKLAPLSTLVEDVKALRSEVIGLKESLEMAHGLIERFSDTVSKLENRVVKLEDLTKAVPVLQSEVNNLKQQLEERDQWARSNNVEIRGVPWKKNENLFVTAEMIGKISNCSVKKEDINYIARIPTRVSQIEKPILISFNNRYKKEEFVALARQSKKLFLNNLGYSSDKQFYVNDHLTQRNKDLLSKAKSRAKEHHFQYVWVKHSKIMARKSETAPVLYIKSVDDLVKIS